MQEKVLHYMETEGLSGRKVQERVTSSFEYIDELTGEKRQGSRCSILSLLLRNALQESFATPAFGEDTDKFWLDSNQTSLFSIIINFYMLLPFLFAHIIDDGGTYDAWSIACIISSVIIMHMMVKGPPHGFTLGAIYSIRRRSNMLHFLNNLFSDGDNFDPNKDGVDNTVWRHRMDMCANNIELWRYLPLHPYMFIYVNA